MPLPTGDIVYNPETPLWQHFGYANKIKYSACATFCGIAGFEQSVYGTTTKTTRYCFEQNTKAFNLKKFLQVNVCSNSSSNNDTKTYTAHLELMCKKFNVVDTTYTLSIALEAPLLEPLELFTTSSSQLQQPSTTTTPKQISLENATNVCTVHFWCIRCSFNDDDVYTFCVSFSSTNSNASKEESQNYTMTVECCDRFIEPDQFIVVNDLLYKFYRFQYLCCKNSSTNSNSIIIKPTFVVESTIPDLTAEQRMLLATMELVYNNTTEDNDPDYQQQQYQQQQEILEKIKRVK